MNLRSLFRRRQLLLDKGVLRRYLEGVRNTAAPNPTTSEQRDSIEIVEGARPGQLLVARSTWNLLQRVAPPTQVVFLRHRLRVVTRGSYQRRWARRLRNNFGFSREDAHLLALATFGTDADGTFLGVDGFVTYDLRLLRRFLTQRDEIAAALTEMTGQMPRPYGEAALPEVVSPDELPELAPRQVGEP